MRVEVPVSPSTSKVYLQGLRDYPDPACRPQADPSGYLAILELSLKDVYQCATTRVTNKLTGNKVYYQTIVIEYEVIEDSFPTPQQTRDVLHVKCSVSGPRNHTITRRNVLPAGFKEPEELDIMTNLTQYAPEPQLGVGVRQRGKLVIGELNVSPGALLQMEIFLDQTSAPIYGLLVTHMKVTDTKNQEEIIIYNGCSVDPYLFANFITDDGDLLSATFRAFKFPESTYVQFRGTVNVCLDKCRGVECSDGQIGYGRKRREIPTMPADPNKIFEITITSFIKVNYDDGSEEVIRNQTKIFNNKKLTVGNQITDNKIFHPDDVNPSNLSVMKIKEEERYTSIMADETTSSAEKLGRSIGALLFVAVFRLLL